MCQYKKEILYYIILYYIILYYIILYYIILYYIILYYIILYYLHWPAIMYVKAKVRKSGCYYSFKFLSSPEL